MEKLINENEDVVSIKEKEVVEKLDDILAGEFIERSMWSELNVIAFESNGANRTQSWVNSLHALEELM